ncbi:hypothetical protein RU07_18705 [Agrobacterium tumefaciens]|uniref:Uncharacterized protein n=1 Tax=Agrobacterium tumefaciens TaxID=358 RepID=A0A0D0JVC4_AGRTU|nr:hypothetical protein RU07_18705 [Agrobacterium tumefaciens]
MSDLSTTHSSSSYYSIPLDGELDDYSGAGSWRGHADRGAIGGAVAFSGSMANGNGIGQSAALGGIGFAGGAAASMYNGGFSGRGNSSGRVICTHFYRRGMLDREVWLADMEFTYKNLSAQTARGYHHWAIPYVRLMRRSPLAERVMLPLAKARALELAYQMGQRDSGSYFGKLLRLIGEPICYVIGYFVEQKEWESLWADAAAK